MGGSVTKSSELRLGSTPSHGNPSSTSALNTELNNVARNTNNTQKARALVEAGASLSSTNGPSWRHTPLHQAAYHGRYEMAKTLVELGAPLDLHSNPCGRGATGTPLELARGGGHAKIAKMLEEASGATGKARASGKSNAPSGAQGRWEVHKNVDMCFQGDVEIIPDWKRSTSLAALKKTVEAKGYSAVCIGSFGHAALKSFEYQLTKSHCKPSHGYTNELHIWFPGGEGAKPQKVELPRVGLPPGFRFRDGFGEATRGDQIGHITSGGVEGHCFKGDKMSWPLQWAAMIGDVDAIDALVAFGHDPNVKMTDWFDSEPLGWAASFGQCTAIEALCGHGADPRRPANTAGNTPLSDAEREGHRKAIALINDYLSGKRPIGEGGKPRASGKAAVAATTATPLDPPNIVVMGEVLVGTPVVGTVAGSSRGELPTLMEMVSKLKVELGIDGSVADVVAKACEELGVSAKGKSLVEQAGECWSLLMVGAGPVEE